MISTQKKLKSFGKDILLYIDSLTECRLKNVYKALVSNYDFYPAFCCFRTISVFELKNFVSTRNEQKNSIQKYYCKKGAPISLFMKEINCKDIDDIDFEEIRSNKSNCEEILKTAPYQHTLWLSEYFRLYGDLRVADFMRCQSLSTILNEQKKSKNLLEKSLQAALELKKYEKILEILYEKNLGNYNKKNILKFKALALACLGQYASAKKIWTSFFNSEDRIFERYINGKSIAVVGPSLPNSFVADEIDSYDLVIRTNYRSEKKLPAEIYGKRTDISYCNEDYPVKTSLPDARHLKYMIFPKETQYILFNKIKDKHAALSRVNFIATPLFWSGFSNAIPKIIYDLLYFSPGKIKIFCSNFFTSKIRVHKNYQNASRSKKRVFKNQRRHDLMSNFMFCKNLYQCGLFQGDGFASEVLNMDRAKYAEAMNEIIKDVNLNDSESVS